MEQNAPDYSVIIRDRMKFSVVIPTYNRADLIKKSLESVYAQTYQDWEIIVVDNCSTDNTEEVMAEYVKRGKLSYLRNDRNYERSYSRNKGMKLAKGEYVTLLDSDDILYPDCLDKAAKFIDKNPESVFFHCCFAPVYLFVLMHKQIYKTHSPLLTCIITPTGLTGNIKQTG